MMLSDLSQTPLFRNSKWFILPVLLLAGCASAGLALYLALQAKPPIPQIVYQLELQNLILDSCTDCNPNEIVYQQGPNGIVAEFQRRNSVCPHVVIGSRFATLGIKRSVIAQIDGRDQTIAVGSVFQSCLIKWQVQFSGG